MTKKLTGKALAKLEGERDVWQEVLNGVREIKGGGGKRTVLPEKSDSHLDRVSTGSGSDLVEREESKLFSNITC